MNRLLLSYWGQLRSHELHSSWTARFK